jgi:hypothetical protein
VRSPSIAIALILIYIGDQKTNDIHNVPNPIDAYWTRIDVWRDRTSERAMGAAAAYTNITDLYGW